LPSTVIRLVLIPNSVTCGSDHHHEFWKLVAVRVKPHEPGFGSGLREYPCISTFEHLCSGISLLAPCPVQVFGVSETPAHLSHGDCLGYQPPEVVQGRRDLLCLAISCPIILLPVAPGSLISGCSKPEGVFVALSRSGTPTLCLIQLVDPDEQESSSMAISVHSSTSHLPDWLVSSIEMAVLSDGELACRSFYLYSPRPASLNLLGLYTKQRSRPQLSRRTGLRRSIFIRHCF